MGSRNSSTEDRTEGEASSSSCIVDTDVDENNGFILNNVYIPEEMLIQILFFVDHDSLVYYDRLVCKVWRRLIESSVLKLKVDKGLYQSSSMVDSVPRQRVHLNWKCYHLIWKYNPFNKNLLRNPSGTDKLKHWSITADGGDHWIVEEKPATQGVNPLPESDKNSPCFTTSYENCQKEQIIRLAEHGLNSEIMDKIQPVIFIRELYSARWDCGAVHYISVTLLDKNHEVIDEFEKSDTIIEQMDWHEVCHEFSNYGPGVRFIRYRHGGRDTQFWAGHYGAKIAGSTVKLIYPTYAEVLEAEDDLDDSVV